MLLQKLKTGKDEGQESCWKSWRLLLVLTGVTCTHSPPSRELKPEAEVEEDGVVMCSGPEEEEEVDQVKGLGEKYYGVDGENKEQVSGLH